jgi:putative flippase GtrA
MDAWRDIIRSFSSGRFLRFVAVGLCNTAVFFIVFIVANAITCVPRWAAVALAFFSATLFQYAANAGYTFERKVFDTSQVVRYLASLGCGLALSELIMLSGPGLGLPELLTSIIVVFSLALLNWVLFLFWVFKGRQP